MRTAKDALARRATGLVAALPGLLVVVIVIGLFLKSRAILGVAPLSKLLFSPAWHPVKGEFGLLAFIAGTVWVTVTAMVLAVPVSILAAVYLSEYAPRRVREAAKPVVDLLAGLPSVVYGVWGVLLVVPFVSGVLAPLAGVYSSGYSILAGGIVLAVMSFPTIIHVTLEVFTAVPRSLRDASLSLGATKWETTRRVVLRKGAPGILAAAVLGFSRAFGETMAVLMVVGNVPAVPRSLFDPGYPLPALIANNYGEMMSVPRYDAALMTAALVLMVIVLGFNVLARAILVRVERRAR
ncbi:MAG: phosphate ABC transporter permease subunit PstC [Candidatus Aminicenantes bacterium]|nr:phosphate ABC transporter permease subunit PstC [Candidatus Aminicenantes bacterium]NLH77267.1 phosphate ABC transporter permease subunit PstC [Acidobacteriota bacterium]